jgi:spore coat polysaccharide biosynthesis protein SpsF
VALFAIVQARMSSSRLPGKVLMDIAGMPMIGRQIERIKEAKLISDVIVATSVHPTDDPLIDYVRGLDVMIHRGPLDDVLQRFTEVLDSSRAENFVRLTADCPLADPKVIDAAVQLFLDSDYDYVSNTLDRSYPRGLDVEVAKSDVLREVKRSDFRVMAREHVTYGIYTRPDLYSCGNLKQDTSQAAHRWTVDNSEDLQFIRNVYKHFLSVKPSFRQQDVLDWLKDSPECAHFESGENN